MILLLPLLMSCDQMILLLLSINLLLSIDLSLAVD
jgi:hypothetical protein